MNISAMYRNVMNDLGLTQTDVAAKVGVNQSSVASFLGKGNPSLGVLNRYLRPLGYYVAIVPDSAELPDGCYDVEPTPSKTARDGYSGGSFIEDPAARRDNAWNFMMREYFAAHVEGRSGKELVWIKRGSELFDSKGKRTRLVIDSDAKGKYVSCDNIKSMTDVELYGADAIRVL